jgi:uncharacterized protein YjbJ (UPF0337 family)
VGESEGIKGKAKEVAGAVTDDERLKREGEAQQDKAEAEREAEAAKEEAASYESEQRRNQ